MSALLGWPDPRPRGNAPTLTQPALPTDEDFVHGARRLSQADVALGLLPRDTSCGMGTAALEMCEAQPHLRGAGEKPLAQQWEGRTGQHSPCWMSFQRTQYLELSSNVTRQLCLEPLTCGERAGRTTGCQPPFPAFPCFPSVPLRAVGCWVWGAISRGSMSTQNTP